MATNTWREAALAKSEIISDAWEVTKTYAGRIAEWVLFLCMVMNIIEILVTLPLTLSSIVLGTQVVMLDVGGFSLATMGEQAREQGDERAASRASLTGYFLIGITIATLLLVTTGLLWSAAKYYTDMAEKGLILVRVVMTVIYAHVIHGLRRATAHAHTQQVEAVAAMFTEQVEQLAAELARVQENVHRRLPSELAHVRESVQVQLATELAPLRESVQHTEAQLEALIRQHASLAEAVHEAHEAHHKSREAKPSASAQKSEARTKVLPLRQREAVPTEKRAAVYALLDKDHTMSSYQIAEQTGYPPSTVQRYMKDWKVRQVEAADEATKSQATHTAS